MSNKIEKTNAIRALEQKKIEFNTYEYDAEVALSGEEVAKVLNEDPNKVFKTLVTIGKSNNHYVFLVPVNSELDLKKAATAVHEKNIEMIKNKDLLQLALTHSSYANELGNQAECNERLEFLGDSVLSIIVSDYLYNHFETPEGDLTKLRASLVCEEALFDFAKQINLGDYIKLGKGEYNNGGNKRPSILSDAFEALLAAMYLDGGIEPVKLLVLRFVKIDLKDRKRITFKDYKTELQEVIQKNPEEKIQLAMDFEPNTKKDDIIKETIEKIDVLNTTPMEALNVLFDLKQKIKKG